MSSVVATPLSYHTAQAIALTTYADAHPDFACRLAQHIATSTPAHTPCFCTHTPSPYLLPPTPERADARAAWLIRECHIDPHSAAHQHLTAWYHARPEAVVLGIVGVAILGPTLGIIDKRKKNELSELHVVTSSTHAVEDATTLASDTSQISTQFLAHALRVATGDATRLEPEVADWCFFDQITTLYHTTNQPIADIAERLTHEAVPYTARALHTPQAMLAITPAVNTSILTACGLEKQSV